ncbi:imidazole glycerol phosphate synthase subunit HisH [Thermodesulfobacteriota bacterium]
MQAERKIFVAVIDYGLGNLFSIRQACEKAGMRVEITFSKQIISAADIVILPGVGAFGDAMDGLQKLDLVTTLKDIADSGKPLIGICLGLQLLFTESYEFGWRGGLDIIEGEVIRFKNPKGPNGPLKVPQVCWNRVYPPSYPDRYEDRLSAVPAWESTPLWGIRSGSYMYFVHSFYGVPQDRSVILSNTRYGNVEFCSALKKDNVYAFQFHPERSGRNGLKIYENLSLLIREGKNN